MAELRTPPGPKGNPLFGHARYLMDDPLSFWERCHREYGDIVGIRLPFMRIVMLAHPKDIDFVLRQHHKSFIKDILTRRLSILLGQGLLTSEHEFWRRQRKMAQPFFQSSQIRKLDSTIVSFTSSMLDRWRVGEARDVHSEMLRVTLQIIAKKLFNTEVEDETDLVAHALEDLMEYFLGPVSMMPFAAWYPLPSTIRFRRALRKLNAFLFEIVRKRRRSSEQGDDLLSFLLAARDEDGKGMTDLQLRDELMTLFLAGHETTALSLSFAFYLLSMHPEAESKVLAELQQVLGNRSPTSSDIPRLAYLNGVIQEAMRLYPPAWSVGREAIEDVEIGGYSIPKGCQVWMAQWVVHRNPRWFPDPLAFRPERWLDSASTELPRGAYFPFGDGPRVCIGNQFAMLESALVLATILQRFQLEVIDKKPLKLLPSVTLRPAEGLPMRLVMRGRAAANLPTHVAETAHIGSSADIAV